MKDDGLFALFDGPTKTARCGLDMVPALAARGIRIRAGARIGALADADEVLKGIGEEVEVFRASSPAHP